MENFNLTQAMAAMDGFSSQHQDELRQVLAHVNAEVLRRWLDSGALREWVAQGLRLFDGKPATPAGELSAFLNATPTMLAALSTKEVGEWTRVGHDLRSADTQIFSQLPSGFSDLSETERVSFYRLVRTAAYRTPQVGAALYRSLPRSLLLLPAHLRPLLLRILQAAVSFDPEPLPAVVPFLAPTLRSLSPESQTSLLERIAQMSQIFPAGVARLLRILARAYEEVGEEGIKAWIAAGEIIAAKNPHAGEAFFALESRTSLLLLRGVAPTVTLSDVYAVLLKYIHMLCGDAVGITETSHLTFPPLLPETSDAALPLPSQIDVFPTYEENFRLYRVLAAHQAGRVAFGTYDMSVQRVWPLLPTFVHNLLQADQAPPDDLASYFQLFPRPEQIEALFLFIETRRIGRRLTAQYRGLREDLTWASSLTQLMPPALAEVLPRIPRPLWQELDHDASAYDALLLATELHIFLIAPGSETSASDWSQLEPEMPEEMSHGGSMFEDTVNLDEPDTISLSLEAQSTLRKLLAAARASSEKRRGTRRRKATVVLNLDADPQTAQDPEAAEETKHKPKRRRPATRGRHYLYDEWDYLIEDYRSQWCQVREIPMIGDDGVFFSRTLATYADLTPEIKREFQRLRPRLYRHVKGLEDGEEIDLDAAITARVDLRTGNTHSGKLYSARLPVERDVAALFLLDLSASTDTLIAAPPDSGPPGTGSPGARVIDIMKEALVLLSAALDTIGDTYAIYGFSSAGRRDIDIYPVKTFAEPLSQDVRSRIGGLTPQRSTRMGAAVRHGIRQLRTLSSRAKFLVLLSDGCPEDMDYGPDKHSTTYGVRDTMMALREAERNGILSFCLTVDKAGRDYLREMCAPARYMIIEDMLSLPAQLPKIYQRYIRSQKL
ncbi:MAG: hypothetical protein EXR78_08460 [Deltaproteobacteria bacterium]|nr:hypothetical protein [Deltaproteobacteria bacterium]